MGWGEERFKQVLRLLPEGWESKTKELGALQRAREIKTPEELLRLILLYLTEGKSFAGTSALIQLKENQRKRGGKPVSELQRESNKYIIVATSLGDEVSAAEVMELYRARWQIEIAFKRLKSLFQYNDLSAKQSESALAWFYGKLLLAALCETLVNTGRFSPSAKTSK